MLKYIYILLGTISLILGLLGIVTPGLPTTPFLLLTAFLYAKSSPRLHQKLLDNKVTGAYLNRVSGGLSLKARIFSIAFMWVMVSFTAFFVFKNNETMKYVMLGLGIVGTIAQLIVLRKRNPKKIEVFENADAESQTNND